MNILMLPPWAFNQFMGTDDDVKVEELVFMPLSWDDKHMNREEFGDEGHGFSEEAVIMRFNNNHKEDSHVVVIKPYDFEVTVYPSLDDALGFLLGDKDSSLADALQDCVDYRLMSERDLKILLDRLKIEEED